MLLCLQRYEKVIIMPSILTNTLKMWKPLWLPHYFNANESRGRKVNTIFGNETGNDLITERWSYFTITK